jgi:hypothetical protein
LPSNTRYYASRPPAGSFVQVYARKLSYIVWVPLASAEAHGWYASHGERMPTWELILTLLAGALVIALALEFVRRRRS